MNGHNCNILRPEGIYNISISTNATGGGNYPQVNARQPIQGRIKANVFGETSITIDVHGNPNSIVEASIDYQY